MALYVIGDLHLSLGVDKPMDVFGGAWIGYQEKIKESLSALTTDDTLVLAGDTSWGMSLEQTAADFSFLESFPFRKILIKGNHDYWWTTAAKMQSFFDAQGYIRFEILHNNALAYNNIMLVGTRGWFLEEDRKGGHNQKVFQRECMRLEASLREAAKRIVDPPEEGEWAIAFLHYPPLYEGYRCDEIIEILKKYRVKRCYFGHLHGAVCARAIEGLYDGIDYRLVSADHLRFQPVRVL